MRFLTRRYARRHWVAFLGLLTMPIVVLVNIACTPSTTKPAAVSQGTNPETAQSPAASNVVTIQGFQFSPDAITVKRGTTVTFINKDATPHTVTPEKGSAFTGTGRLQKDESKQVTFDKVGEQSYFCEIHPSMKGKITVVN